jgi:hypothetical protein
MMNPDSGFETSDKMTSTVDSPANDFEILHHRNLKKVVKGIDFGEIFSPIAKLISIRLLLSIVVAFDLWSREDGCEDNIPTWGFWRRNLHERPEGFIATENKELVCKLKKSLYALKQSPRMQHQTFDTHIMGLGFSRRKVDHYVFRKLVIIMFIWLYVDNWKQEGNYQGC